MENDVKPSSIPELTLRTPDEILAMEFDDSDRYMGDRLITRGGTCCLVGPPGVGKSRLQWQLAAAMRLGRKFIGFPTQGENLRWLFLQAENSTRRLQHDLLKLQRWAGDGWAHVKEGLTLHTLERDFDSYVALTNDRNRDALIKCVERAKVDIVVWDCLQSYSSGDLNKDEIMFDTCSALSRITRMGNPDRTTIALHHARAGRLAAAQVVGEDKGMFARNSKALLGWARAVINIAPASEDGSILIIACGKCSDGREFQPFAVRLNHGTMMYEVDPDFDMVEWRADINRKTARAIADEAIADLCGEGISKSELIEKVKKAAGVGQATAARYVEKAEKHRKIYYLTDRDLYIASLPS